MKSKDDDIQKVNEEATSEKQNKIGHIILELKEKIIRGSIRELTCKHIDSSALDILIP